MIDTREALRLQQLLILEEEAKLNGYGLVAGIDEAGRGPLAGPVVAAACLWIGENPLPGVNDSKKLSARQRQHLFASLTTHPSCLYGVGVVSPEIIDEINIFQATKLAMRIAVQNLPQKPDYLLIDGLEMPDFSIPNKKIIKGDAKSYSIAAASIIAKETRDRLMDEYHEQWPLYGFHKHKGYGTAAHYLAIETHGPCSIHRKTFRGCS